jgi:hypothetical protein
VSDKYQHLTVTFASDRTKEEALPLMNAIKLMWGVRRVELGRKMEAADYLARDRAAHDLRNLILYHLNQFAGMKE